MAISLLEIQQQVPDSIAQLIVPQMIAFNMACEKFMMTSMGWELLTSRNCRGLDIHTGIFYTMSQVSPKHLDNNR